ncbi:unnamed protein product [Symbiodinium sp. CCMP2592]|nr:unnamed protein product [Symbiodinium sp. CCMP2592]
MDSGGSSPRLDASFLVVTGAFQIVFVCRLVYSGLRHRGYLCSAARSIIKTVARSFQRPKLADDERLVLEQLSQVRLHITRWYVKCGCVMLALPLCFVQWNVLMASQRPTQLPASLTWSWAGVFCVCTAVDMFPAVLSVRYLNMYYALASVVWAAHLSPWHVTPERSAEISLFILGLGRVPAVGIATSPVVVAACSLLPLLVVLFRAGTEAMPPVSIFAEVCGFVATVCASASLQLLLSYRIERSLQYKKMETDFNAASSLLHLTCDAVVELDADLRMTEHKASLSAMLLRCRSGGTLAGMDFTDLLAGAAEASRVVELLRRFEDCSPESVNAQAFLTHLMDSDYNRFRTEIFQVMYHTPQGVARHLIGLRDVTDQDSLAGSKVVESMLIAPRSITPMSAGACSSLDSQPSAPAAPLQTGALAEDRFLSILIDMDLQIVQASSLLPCLGKHPASLFSAAGVELLERSWREMDTGSSALSFSALEIRLDAADACHLVSGTLQLVQSTSGSRNLLLVCIAPLSVRMAPNCEVEADVVSLYF